MRCENRLCVYWRASRCILEEVTLDRQGGCQSCVYIYVEERAHKRRARRKAGGRVARWLRRWFR